MALVFKLARKTCLFQKKYIPVVQRVSSKVLKPILIAEVPLVIL